MQNFLILGRGGAAPSDTRFIPTPFGEADPFGAHRQMAWSGDNGMSVGRVAWQGNFATTSFPHTELFVVQSGQLEIDDGHGLRRVAAGEMAVAPCGSALRLRADIPASWIYCAARSTPGGGAGPLVIDKGAALTASAPPAAEVLLGPEPSCRSFGAFADEASQVRVGLWDSTPYRRKEVLHKTNEFMYFLEGSVTLTDGSGRAVVFGAGDAVFVPHRSPCTWHSQEYVRKLYCSQDFPG